MNIRKNKKRYASIAAAAAAVVLGLTGCSTSSTGTSTASSGSSGAFHGSANETYYMVTFLSGIEYWKGVYAGMQAAAKDLGVKTVFTGAPQYDINQEVTTMQQVIAKKPAGIMVTSINAQALTPVINQAIAAGIPVISFDSDAPQSERYAYLGTSNVEAGQKAADYLGQQLNGKGEVAVISTPGELNLDQRVQGFRQEMSQKYPGIKIVAVQNGNSDQIKTAQVTSALLQSYPGLGGIFATEADEGTGAATAVKEANKTGSVKIVSFDTDKATLDAIKSGEITATVAQGTWNMGFWGLMDLFTIHHNLLTPVANWKQSGVDPVPPQVDTGVTIVTSKNVNAYLSK
ncbi:sugar ABC transporter substrate-binding protein [Alicyclobacillus hesperidum]|uniref:Monosaccharide ABC transporter substrate-binding protein, CUT2 family n=1 Tax=Alicyclobacillus hesperidum TaxID=89784 RepID=A0A1H2YGR9_9BACL|nr:substrate-binding domain-containing protein [Alicyclobacillus hesperidum]GLV15007.1 sugar ABC transporter substrate-binding protein [Alicyclobacillus hesperidum]SDX04402.1 monosaccharide ABC transporter substrate-binding protein, CUT2 family [Alicyclobacillus hesperidum]